MVTAIAQPEILTKTSQQNMLVMLDVSDSMKGQSECPNLSKKIKFETKKFADGLNVSSLKNSETKIAPALKYIIQKIDNDEIFSVLIKTDGQIVDIDSAILEKLKNVALSKKVPLKILPADKAFASVQIVKFSARNLKNTSSEVTVKIQLKSNAKLSRNLKVYKTVDGNRELLGDYKVNLLPNEIYEVTANYKIAPDKYTLLEAKVEEGKSDYSAPTFLVIYPQKKKVLLIADFNWLDKMQKEFLDELTKSERYILVKKTPSQCGGKPFWYKNFSGIIIFSGMKSILPTNKITAILKAVSSGVSLFKIGVDTNANVQVDNLRKKLYPLAAGIDRRTPVNLTILLDASGSMQKQYAANSKVTKFKIASDSVNSIRDLITKKDSVNIVTFANDSKIIYESSASPDFRKISKLLETVTPEGASNIASGLEKVSSLASAEKQNIVIVLTDFETQKFNAALLANKYKNIKAEIYFIDTNKGKDKSSDLLDFVNEVHATTITCRDYKNLQQIFQSVCSKYRGDLLRKNNFVINKVANKSKDIAKANGIIVSNIQPAAGELYVANDGKLTLPFLAMRLVGSGKVLQAAVGKKFSSNEKIIELFREQFSQIIDNELEDFSLNILPSDQTSGFVVKLTTNSDIRKKMEDYDYYLQVRKNAINNISDKLKMKLTGLGAWKIYLPNVEPGDCVEVLRKSKKSSQDDFEIIKSKIIPQTASSELRNLGANYENLRKLASGIGADFVNAQQVESDKFSTSIISKNYAKPAWQYFAGLSLIFMLISWVGYKKSA